MTTCPFHRDGQCNHEKSKDLSCVLADPRAVGCKLLVAWRQSQRVVVAPFTPKVHKQPGLVKPPSPAPEPPKASPFDALMKGS